jgi:hypothetical protein
MSEAFDPFADDSERTEEVRAERTSRVGIYELSLQSVMQTAEGREVLFHILHEHGKMNATSFQGENPLTASFQAGKREVALALWEEMRKVDFGLTHLMEVEARDRARARKERK